MKVYLTPKTLKKIIKMLVLFILACILIYFSNTLNVSAYTLASNSLYTCDLSDNITSGTYNYVLDGTNYTGYYGTTYQGVMSSFSTRFNATIQQGNSYTLEINAYTGDFRNISANSIQLLGGIGTHCSSNINAYTITSVSATYYKITINFIANSTNNYSQIVIYNNDNSVITGISNFKIDSLTLVDNGNSGTNTIIDNQNQNKQDIIDNQNENTNTIIDNQNQSTQDIIDNQEKNNEELKDSIEQNFNNCEKFSVTLTDSDVEKKGYYLDYQGNYFENAEWGVSRYVSLPSSDATYTISGTTGNNPSFCLYDENKTLITCTRIYGTNSYTFSNSKLAYIRTSIPIGSNNSQIIVSTTEICSNRLDDLNDQQKETNDKLDSLNDNITDDSAPDTSGLSNAAGWLPPGPVDSLVNLPINLLNSLLGNMGSTCTNINLTLPFINKDFTIPCPSDLLSRLGNAFLTFWEGFGLIAGCWCLYKYFIALYKWVESALTMDEKEQLGKWGGV